MGRCRVTIHFRNPCIAKKGGVSTVARFFWWISVQRPTLSDNNPIKVIDPPPPPQIYNILQKVIIHPQFVKISPEILYFIMSIYAFFVPISISVCQNWRVDRAGGKPILAMPRFRKILVTLPFPYGVSESVTDVGTQWSDPMSTRGSTGNPTDPEVTTEPINHNRCQRPLQRARERREARLKKESDAHAELDPHAGQQRSSLSSAQEQDCVHPQSSSESLPHDPAVEGWKPGETYSAGDEVPADVGRACWACNAYGADVEWHQHEGIAMCRRCVDDYRTSESGRSLLLQLKVGYEERQNSQ